MHGGATWLYNHITIEEADAMAWSLSSRLERANKCGLRVMHGGGQRRLRSPTAPRLRVPHRRSP